MVPLSSRTPRRSALTLPFPTTHCDPHHVRGGPLRSPPPTTCEISLVSNAWRRGRGAIMKTKEKEEEEKKEPVPEPETRCSRYRCQLTWKPCLPPEPRVQRVLKHLRSMLPCRQIQSNLPSVPIFHFWNSSQHFVSSILPASTFPPSRPDAVITHQAGQILFV